MQIRFAVGGVLLLAAMIWLSVIWNNSVKTELADQAAMLVRNTLSRIDPRRVIESLNGVQLASFESITQFDRNGQRVVTLPATLAPVAYRDRDLLHKIVFAEVRVDLFFDDEGKNSIGSLSFVYPRFGAVEYAAAAWLFLMFFLGMMLSTAQKKLRQEFQREIEVQNARFTDDLIQKVRHNIRSPLAVLGSYFSQPDGDEFQLREQGQRAVYRIEEILSEMKRQDSPQIVSAATAQTKALVELSVLAQQIVEEKRLIAPRIEVSYCCASRPVYGEVPAMEFKATLSNILDNAIQALNEEGKIDVTLEADGHLVTFRVKDNGRGIPEENLSLVTEKHFTSGKEEGSGLGLYYAQRLMDENCGSLNIESELGTGTVVSMFFPQKATPSWHCDEISLGGVEKINVYDDQPLVLELFRRKLAGSNIEVKLHLVDGADPKPNLSPCELHFLDFDFGPERKNGLEILASSGVAQQAILVTGHFDDPSVQAGCTQIGCKLLPKDRISNLRLTNADSIL